MAAHNDMTLNEVQRIVDAYLKLFPTEAPDLAELQRRLEIDETFNNRGSFQGHGTGGAIVLSPDRKKVLLIRHKKLQMWLQPGGHWDPEDPNPWTVAQREAEEETGVDIATLLPVLADQSHVPLDIDTHVFPASATKGEPEHFHHDFRYAFLARSEELSPLEAEVTAAAWVSIDSDDERLKEVKECLQKLHDLHMA